jgi:hypothetical protein
MSLLAASCNSPRAEDRTVSQMGDTPFSFRALPLNELPKVKESSAGRYKVVHLVRHAQGKDDDWWRKIRPRIN